MILHNLCNICGGRRSKPFSALILQKYNADYFKCESCGFIQTENPYWLKEAYRSAITDIDVGLIYRNIQFSGIVENILLKHDINPNGKFIDYGGGYGMFVRLMRDKGFDFYRQDIHCQNLFAKYFDITDIKNPQQFDLLTTFEVFEHLEDPIEELKKMFSFANSILFSTELLPHNNPIPATWWYFAPETGQHISFYTMKSLEVLAKKFNVYLYSNGTSMHMFTKRRYTTNPFEKHQVLGRIHTLLSLFKLKSSVKKRESLLSKDFESIKNRININMDQELYD